MRLPWVKRTDADAGYPAPIAAIVPVRACVRPRRGDNTALARPAVRGARRLVADMLNFAVFDADGKPQQGFVLRHAHLVGPDDLPVQGDVRCEEGVVKAAPARSESTGLVIQVEVPNADAETLASLGLPTPTGPSLGVLTLQTALLPQRDEPYMLWLELARHRMLLFLNKLEDWGLFDNPTAEAVLKQFELARQRFSAALVASRDGASGATAARTQALAIQALSLAIDAGERLAIVNARAEFPARLAGETYARAVKQYTKATGEKPPSGAAVMVQGAVGVALPAPPQIGITVEPTAFGEPFARAVSAAADFISLPLRWNDLEPAEGKYAFGGTDRWIEWAVRTAKLPVVAGPLIDLRAVCVPEWLYIWENDYETLRDMVAQHVTNVVTRYRKTVARWTVAGGLNVNTNIKLSIEQILDLTRVAVGLVKKLHPQGRVQVEIAEPWGEYHARTKRSIPPLVYADALFQMSLPLDSIALRLQIGQPDSGRSTRDLMAISALVDRYGAFQRPLFISALGAPSQAAPPVEALGDSPSFDPGYWRLPWMESTQADWVAQVFAMLLSKPHVQSICWQQLADTTSVTAEMPGGGLVAFNGTPKPVFTRIQQIRQALREGRVPGGIPGLGQF